MKTNRTKRSVFFCRAAALIALTAVCMIGCQNATDGSDGNSKGGGNTPQSAVERYFVDFYTDGWHGGALTAKVDGKEIHSGDRVEQGKIVEFTAQPESGKRADTWFIEGGSFEAGSGTAGSDTAKVRVLNNISVRVSFKDVEAGKHIVRFSIEGSAGESRLSAAVAGGSAILSGNEVSDGSVVEFTARPESGKTVDRWFIEGGNFEAGSGTAGSDTARVKVSGNINVRVVFKDADPNKHIVTFGIEGNAGESAVTAKVTEGWRIASGNEVSDGAFVEFTAVPAPGYKVKSWTIVKTEDNNPLLFEEGGTGGSLRAKARAACNLTVKVEFERILYTIVFGFEGSSDQGTFTAQKDGANFVSGATAFYGEELAFSAQPKAGWKVAVWTIVKTDDSSPLTFEEGGAEGSLTAKAKVTCNITVKVKFEKIICTVSFTVPGDHGSLKAKAEGAAFVSVSPIGVEYGKTVEFTASPAAGYKVKAWTIVNTDSGSHLEFESGTGTPGSVSAKAKVFSPVTVRVEFEKTYTVVFTVPCGHGSLTAKIEDTDFITGSPMNVGHGKTVEFTAVPNAGYKVKEWTVNGAVVTAGSTYRLTVVQDVHLIVTFTEDNVRITISGDERVDEGGYIDITRGKRWGDVKKQIKAKFALKEEWQGGDYGLYRWALDNENGNTISDNHVFTEDTVVYAVTNYLKFKIEGRTKLIGYDGAKPRGRIIIDDTVTKIKAGAFNDCTGLTGKLKLPAKLTEIEDRDSYYKRGVFQGCTGLQGVDFSACTALTKIGSDAFLGCNGLREADLSACTALTEIGELAFYKCTSLTGELKLPASLTEVGERAFYECKGLQGVDFSACTALTKIGSDAFSSCTGLRGELKLPVGLAEIGERAFYECKGLQGVDFSACTKLTKIGWYAFCGCTGLRGELKLPISLTEIGDGAFYKCKGLTGELKLPASLTEIGGDAFSDCTGLTGELKLPASLTKIGGAAFSGCTGLTGILKLPANLEVIDGDPMWGGAFRECTGLIGLDFSACTKLTEIGRYAFLACTSLRGELKLPASLTEIGTEAFKGCTGLQGVDFSACTALTKIGSDAFRSCTGLRGELKLPVSLTEIGSDAFVGCTSLTGELKLPASLTKIGWYAFSGCTGLQRVNFSACTVLEKIEFGTFHGCTGLTGTIVFPASLKEIDAAKDYSGNGSKGAFEGCTGITGADFSTCSMLSEIGTFAFFGCSKLASITLPPGLTVIKEKAFAGCTNLASVTFPSSLMSIEDYAFSDCDHLTTIVFSQHFPTIGVRAFSDTSSKVLDLSACTACTEDNVKSFNRYRIETIKLPSNFTVISKETFADFSKLSLDFSACTGITAIADRAFDYCSNIKGIKLPPNITTIGDWSFHNCEALERIDASGCTSLTSIGKTAFSSCKQLSSVDLSACTVLSDIGESAFAYCKNLTSVNFPVNLRNIKSDAFVYCENLTSVDLSACTSLTEISYSAFADCTKAEVMLPENITSIAYGAFGGTLEYGRIESYCKKVKIKGGAQFNRIKALVIASEYPESMIVSY